MKEYVYVEFIFTEEDHDKGKQMLAELGDDFVQLNVELEWDYEDPSDADFFHKYSGRINSVAASIIKIKYAFLCEKMRISYIPDELKDLYRR